MLSSGAQSFIPAGAFVTIPPTPFNSPVLVANNDPEIIIFGPVEEQEGQLSFIAKLLEDTESSSDATGRGKVDPEPEEWMTCREESEMTLKMHSSPCVFNSSPYTIKNTFLHEENENEENMPENVMQRRCSYPFDKRTLRLVINMQTIENQHKEVSHMYKKGTPMSRCRRDLEDPGEEVRDDKEKPEDDFLGAPSDKLLQCPPVHQHLSSVSLMSGDLQPIPEGVEEDASPPLPAINFSTTGSEIIKGPVHNDVTAFSSLNATAREFILPSKSEVFTPRQVNLALPTVSQSISLRKTISPVPPPPRSPRSPVPPPPRSPRSPVPPPRNEVVANLPPMTMPPNRGHYSDSQMNSPVYSSTSSPSTVPPRRTVSHPSLRRPPTTTPKQSAPVFIPATATTAASTKPFRPAPNVPNRMPAPAPSPGVVVQPFRGTFQRLPQVMIPNGGSNPQSRMMNQPGPPVTMMQQTSSMQTSGFGRGMNNGLANARPQLQQPQQPQQPQRSPLQQIVVPVVWRSPKFLPNVASVTPNSLRMM